MPKTKFQNVIFTLLMAFAMVYAMICYNIAINRGGMMNEVFMLAFHEVIIMWPVAFGAGNVRCGTPRKDACLPPCLTG